MENSKELILKSTGMRCSSASRMRCSRSESSLLRQLLTFITMCLLCKMCGACSSRSAPKLRTPPPAPPIPLGPSQRPNITFETYACPPQYATWYCLNGATCFTLKIGEAILYNCECADGYLGERCEFKDLDGSYLPSREKVPLLETASIAGGAVVAILLVVVISVCVYTYQKQKRKELLLLAEESRYSYCEKIVLNRSNLSGRLFLQRFETTKQTSSDLIIVL